MADEKFREWCIVEVMGHQTYAGFVSEQTLGGVSFVRIDVPAVGNLPGFTKLLGASSIYAITPVSEQVARLRAESLGKSPMTAWDLPESVKDRLRMLPALQPPQQADDGFDGDGDEAV